MIGVYGTSLRYNSSFTLTASSAADIVNLQDGIGYHGEVEEEEYSYYRISVYHPHSDLTVSVVTYTGKYLLLYICINIYICMYIN